MRTPTPLLAVPNVSEGRDPAAVDTIAKAFAAGGAARLLDVHADPDHHRAVVSLAGQPGALAQALVQGAAQALRCIDIGDGLRGEHPHVGAIDVVPLVYVDTALQGAACAEALVAADRIGRELAIPVLLYGELAAGRARAELRRGGASALAQRLRAAELHPDFGPRAPHPTAGVTLVGARPPLVAFNLELAAPASIAQAREIASRIREGGIEGLPGLRAIGIPLQRDTGAGTGRTVAQVSMNVERPTELALREVVAAVRRHAEVACAEIVGLAPSAALEGFPTDLPIAGFDPTRQVIEKALGF
jgi:glutamate formiminotransferase / 5-formyltetrahydrofolate cyclo-ligase